MLLSGDAWIHHKYMYPLYCHTTHPRYHFESQRWKYFRFVSWAEFIRPWCHWHYKWLHPHIPPHRAHNMLYAKPHLSPYILKNSGRQKSYKISLSFPSPFVRFLSFFLGTGFRYVAEPGLEFPIPLPQSSEHWYYRPWHPVPACFTNKWNSAKLKTRNRRNCRKFT